jgi:AraC-like DNA-binding protein
LFKKITGTSPGKYINELKIKELKYALISSNESVKEISYKFNFANQDYLTLYFKQRTGLTPTEYRKNNTNQKLIL